MSKCEDIQLPQDIVDGINTELDQNKQNSDTNEDVLSDEEMATAEKQFNNDRFELLNDPRFR